MGIESILGAVAGPVIGKVFGGGSNVGSSGGNAPPAYQPKNQAEMDKAFNDYYNRYGANVQQTQNFTAPNALSTYQSQYGNQYAPGMMAGANAAGQYYGANANQTRQASDNTFGQTNANWNWNNLVRQGMIHDAPQVQNAFSGMMGQADQSNAQYQNLISQQNAQRGNVQNAANQLYTGGNRIMDTAFDPRSAVYNDTAQKVTDQSRASQYARGIQSSPYGAAVESNALGNFNMDWQNQQLARQQQGLQSAQGAYQGGQNMNDVYANNLAGLQEGMGRNYMGLTRGATGMLQDWSQSQAGVANTFGGSNSRDYQAAANLGNTAGQMYLSSGQVPYAAQNDIYGNQTQSTQNYWNSQSPYQTGLGNLQNQAGSYMGIGQIAQSNAFNQNDINNQYRSEAIKSIAGPVTEGIKGIFQGGNQTPPSSSGGGYYGTYDTGSSYGDTGYGTH